ncbi:hypothetical protein TNCV_93661 [Trichonephila clavipes]|nr:hypothetical protein TNCV_93661 [Trichonephila clavipes]
MIAWENVKKQRSHYRGLQTIRLSMLPRTVPHCMNWERYQEPLTWHAVRRVIILHDNARPHVVVVFQILLRQFHLKVLEHPPHSPDFSPCDFPI